MKKTVKELKQIIDSADFDGQEPMLQALVDKLHPDSVVKIRAFQHVWDFKRPYAEFAAAQSKQLDEILKHEQSPEGQAARIKSELPPLDDDFVIELASLTELQNYVRRNAKRGPCTCGRCADAVPDPETKQPVGHTADLVFFEVAAEPTANTDELKRLVQENKKGEFGDLDLFDGKDHSYIEVGGWIGDQGLGLMLMGLGAVLGLWKLLTPRKVFPGLPEDMVKKMAGAGYVSVIAEGAA